MTRYNPFANVLSLAILCIVNLVFVVKYSARIGMSATLAFTAAYTCFSLVAPVAAHRLGGRVFKRSFAIVIAAVFVVFLLVALRLIKVDTIMNDRWSVIGAFFGNLLRGVYPYLAQSNQANQPGPFPFYFVAAFPFYLTGEIGLFTLCSFAALFAAFAARDANQNDNGTLALQTILLVSSPALVYEVIVRSTVFANMALIVIYLFWLDGKMRPGGKSRLLWPAILGGFLLSTRAIAALPLACYLSYALLGKRLAFQYVKMGAGIAFGFVLTFVPLLAWGWAAFAQKNPILLQSGFSPFPVTLAFLAACMAAGLFVKTIRGCLLVCGTAIFAIVAISAALSVGEFGWKDALFGSKFDISYLIFCVPFLVGSIRLDGNSMTSGDSSGNGGTAAA